MHCSSYLVLNEARKRYIVFVYYYKYIYLLFYNTGRVASELCTWVCACAARNPNALVECGASFVKMARACDEAARALPSAARLDADLLGWPGLISRRNQLNNSVIRK